MSQKKLKEKNQIISALGNRIKSYYKVQNTSYDCCYNDINYHINTFNNSNPKIINNNNNDNDNRNK